MNVVFYYGSIKNGGAERIITTLANVLVQKGDSVSILVSDAGESGYYLAPGVKIIGLNNERVSRNLKEAFRAFKKDVKNVRKHIIELRPDVIVAFDPHLAFVAKISCRRISDVKIIGSERSNPYMARTGWKSKLFVKASVLLDGFIFQTDGAKSFYPQRTQNKSVVIPNGVFAETSARIPAYKDRGEWTICASGRLDKVKRYDLMVDAIQKVIEKYPDTVLDIYGEGSYREELEPYIHSKGLQNSVFLKGRIRNITDELVRHRVFLLTSDHEGMPNGLIEAMACGCACISTDCQFGPSELIRNGSNGILVPVGDSGAVADAIERLYEDPEAASEIAEKAAVIKQTHSQKRIAGMYRDYMRQIIGADG